MSNAFRFVKHATHVPRGIEKLFSYDQFSQFNFRVNETSYGKLFFGLRSMETRYDIYLIVRDEWIRNHGTFSPLIYCVAYVAMILFR